VVNNVNNDRILHLSLSLLDTALLLVRYFLLLLLLLNHPLALHSYRYLTLHQTTPPTPLGSLQLFYQFPVLLSQVRRRFLLGLSSFPCTLVEVSLLL
jgi:hypothetical protein